MCVSRLRVGSWELRKRSELLERGEHPTITVGIGHHGDPVAPGFVFGVADVGTGVASTLPCAVDIIDIRVQSGDSTGGGGLVALAEEGWVDTAVTRSVIAEYLAPYRSDPPDSLILGCTHYPVLKSPIREFLDGKTVLIDSGEEAARVVDILLSEGEMKGDGKRPGVSFLVTDDPERFRSVGEAFFGERIDPVEKVSL